MTLDLFIDGDAWTPHRFWELVTEEKIPDSKHSRPKATLNDEEYRRYQDLKDKGIAPILMDDVLDRYCKHVELDKEG